MRGAWERWKAWQADPDWLWWQRLAPIPIAWASVSLVMGYIAEIAAAIQHNPALSHVLRLGWVSFVVVVLALLVASRKRFGGKYVPPVEFPPPPKHRRRRAEIRRGVTRALQPAYALMCTWFIVALALYVLSIDYGDSAVLGAFVNAARPVGSAFLAAGVFLGIVFYRLGVAEYRTSVERLLYPETKRVAELRDKMSELTTTAAAAEGLIQEVVGLQEHLTNAIGLRQRNIEELVELERRREGAAAIQEGKLEALYEFVDKRGAPGRRRERWINVVISFGSIVVGLFLSVFLPPETLSHLLHLPRP